MTPVTAPADTPLSQTTAYQKGELKALGTVQIMIGTMTLLLSIVLIASSMATVTGVIAISGSFIFMVSGALAVTAANHPNISVLKISLMMNGLSAVAAGINLIMYILFVVTWSGSCNYYRCEYISLDNGIYGVLIVFALLQFIISVIISVFACKATCAWTTVMYSHTMPSQPMHNPAFSNPQIPNQTVVTYNI